MGLAGAPCSPASWIRTPTSSSPATRAEEFQLRHAGVSYEELARRGARYPQHGSRDSRCRRGCIGRVGPRAPAKFRCPRHHHRRGQDRLRARSRHGGAWPGRDGCPCRRARLAARCADLPRRAHPPARVSRGRRGTRRPTYGLVCDEMLPAFAGRARFCDVFCERTAFSVEEARRILGTARSLGYRLKLHANQLGADGWRNSRRRAPRDLGRSPRLRLGRRAGAVARGGRPWYAAARVLILALTGPILRSSSSSTPGSPSRLRPTSTPVRRTARACR